MKVRPATPADLPELLTIYRGLYRDSARVAPDYFREAHQDRQYLVNNMQTDYSLVLVAEAEGRVVGFALAQQQLTPPFACFVEHRYCYLMDLAVAEGHRGGGIGSQLVQGVEDWARSRGLDHLELNVLAGNTRAKALYESLGLEPAMINMKKKL